MGRFIGLTYFPVVFLVSFVISGALSQGQEKEDPLKNIPVVANVSYGDDQEQLMDIYPPTVKNETMPTKVILMIHGGQWQIGAKEHMNGIIPHFRVNFPHHVIANMDYRLGTVESPGFPKQVDDIGMAIKYLKDNKAKYKIDHAKFGLMGLSAGGHLASLYGYGFDVDKDVKIVANIVGPTILYDEVYTKNAAFKDFFKPLLGDVSFEDNPEVYEQASPISYLQKTSPVTVGCFGLKDPVVPAMQGVLLEDALDDIGVVNKIILFEVEGHAKFQPRQLQHALRKFVQYIRNYL